MKSLFVAAVLAAGMIPAARDGVELKVGDPAPDFKGKWIDYSQGSRLSDLQGKYVLMEFWRTW